MDITTTPDENTFYTKVKVVFNDGHEFTGDEVQASLVAGFNAPMHNGVKDMIFIEGIPKFTDT
jgi:hypothetical protein